MWQKYRMTLISSPLVVLAMSYAVSGCAEKINTAPSFCTVGRAIYISEEDKLSDETARQILYHDELGERLCGWK